MGYYGWDDPAYEDEDKESEEATHPANWHPNLKVWTARVNSKQRTLRHAIFNDRRAQTPGPHPAQSDLTIRRQAGTIPPLNIGWNHLHPDPSDYEG